MPLKFFSYTFFIVMKTFLWKGRPWGWSRSGDVALGVASADGMRWFLF